jgi:Mannanase, galactose-binding domain-like
MSRNRILAVVAMVMAASCGDVIPGDVGVEQRYLAGALAAGNIPAGLPARLTVGLFEDSGATWMKNSGAKWDVRYRYFVKGWVNNWGWSAYDGSWGLGYMKESSSAGYLPAVQYYQLFGEPGGGEAQSLAKVQNSATMKSYFGDFKILMQRAKDFGKPVLILLEADGFGFLEQQSGNNPNAYAAVAATGLPELAGLPNTVAGWGLAFLQLRKAVGASNAVLGIHVSGWASGKDIAYGSVTDPLGPEVDKVYGFLAPAGLAANVTGQTYDVLVGDPLDRDSDYYRVVQGNPNRWWDASDGASISSRSFNRYAEWLRLWNQKAKRRWVLWQIPLGNSNHKNIWNNGGAREGYKDNRPEYFFGNGTAHAAKFADAGVISLLFGAGASGVSSYQNDTYTDGQLFMKSRAGAFLAAGGLPLAATGGGGTGGSTGGTGGSTGGTGGSTGGTGGSTGGTGGSTGGTGGAVGYDFEVSNQGWSASTAAIAATRSTDRAFTGSAALKAAFNNAPAGSPTVRVSNPTTPAGKVVSFRIWFPAGSALTAVQPYVLQGAAGGWLWTGSWRATSSLTAGQWNTIQVTVPANAAVPLAELGVQLTTGAAWTGSVYVDAVTW